MTFVSDIQNFTPNDTAAYLQDFKMVEAVFGVFDKLIGYQLMVMLVLGLGLVLVYIKTRSTAMVSVVSLLMGAVVATTIGVEMVALLIFISAVTIGGLIHSLFLKR